MPKLRTTELYARFKELDVLLKMFGYNGRCLHTKCNPLNGMGGGWRDYPYRIEDVLSDDGLGGRTWWAKRENMFRTLAELEARVHKLTNSAHE